MDQELKSLEIQREIAAFDEKILLGKLEVSKAQERVSELKYQKARFNLDYINAVIRAKAQQQQETQNKGNS